MRIRSTLIVSCAGAALLAMPAHAQEVEGGATSASAPGEIVVTAQKRSESAQKVPIAITVLGGEALAERGVLNAANLQTEVPALQVAPQVFGNLQLFVRGIGSTSNVSQGDPAIAFNVDGVYVSRTTSSAGALFDVERIEVVKGPQGTLYGRNATGGAINVITRKPRFDGVDGYASLELGNYNALQGEGAINVPLTGNLAARLSFKSVDRDGYMKAVPTASGAVGNDRADLKERAVRLNTLWEPTDDLSINLSADYSHQGGAGGGEQLLPFVTGDPYKVRAAQDVYRNNDFANASLQADYDMGFGTLTYIGAYRFSSIDRKYEYPLTNYPGFITNEDRQWSHELRVGGSISNVSYTVGLYHFDERVSDQELLIQITPVLWQRSSGNLDKMRSNAIFGQVTFPLSDRLRLIGGLRYTADRKSSKGQTANENAAGNVIRVTTVTNGSGKWDAVNWRAGIEYDVGDDSLAYASVSTAYKAGGVFSGSEPNTYAPEHLTAYEIGLKNRFFDRRLTVNLAAYWYDYTDLQVTSLDSDNGTLRTVTRNAGSATIKGFEVESLFSPTANTRFDFSVAYVDARYDSFLLPFGDSFTNFGRNSRDPVDYAGFALPLVPKWSLNAGVQQSFNVAGGQVTGRIQTHYESGKYLDFHQFRNTFQREYTKTDISISYRPDARNWLIEAYVRNLENKAVLTSSIPPLGADPAFAQAYYAPPRLYGGRFRVEF